MYLWKFTCEDCEGGKCYAYIRLYGMKKMGRKDTSHKEVSLRAF